LEENGLHLRKMDTIGGKFIALEKKRNALDEKLSCHPYILPMAFRINFGYSTLFELSSCENLSLLEHVCQI